MQILMRAFYQTPTRLSNQEKLAENQKSEARLVALEEWNLKIELRAES